MPVTFDDLKSVPTFSDLPEEHIQWLLLNGAERKLETGEKLFNRGDPADEMIVLLKGKFQIFIEAGNEIVANILLEEGSISGILPYSRLKILKGVGIALEPCWIYLLHKSKFPEMERISPELTQKLVSVMTNRIREFAAQQQQTEKMMALGKLSAGLAHELNNPASAIRRTSADLKVKNKNQAAHLLSLLQSGADPSKVSEIINFVLRKKEEVREKLSPLDKREKEEELVDWLEDNGMEDSFSLAECFLEAGLTMEDLDHIREIAPEVKVILPFLENLLVSEQMIEEIENASSRISILINSVKVYSHMDQGTGKQQVDVHEGLDSTLVMLGHKLRDKQVQVQKEYEMDLPKINAHVTGLNQAWTNLIDNAIDAMPEKGILSITTKKEGNFIKIIIGDNGVGIPVEIQNKIFDPFFTTKDVGKGTGLGLDIVKRIAKSHKADIKVNSKPGKTEFIFCFPIN